MILDSCIPIKENGYISLLGYRLGDSLMAYPQITRDRAVDFLVCLRYLADFIIMDCSAVFEADVLSMLAMEFPEEHAAVMKDAAALYWARMKEMMDLYDLDQDGVLSPVEKEQALADSHKDSPLYAMEEPDDIDLFIRANISEVLLKEAPVNSGEEKEKGTE